MGADEIFFPKSLYDRLMRILAPHAVRPQIRYWMTCIPVKNIDIIVSLTDQEIIDEFLLVHDYTDPYKDMKVFKNFSSDQPLPVNDEVNG